MVVTKNYFHAIATLVGTVVGVGMFSVPFVVYKAGIVLFFAYIVIFGFIQYYMHLMYAEICLSTKKRRRVPGFVVEYYGKRYKKPILVVILTSINLTMLAYIIIGGIFLYELLYPAFGGSPFLYSILFFISVALITYKGVEVISKFELAMSFILFFIIGIIAVNGLPVIELSNYKMVSWDKLFLPYGPILMAIGGMTAIPTVCLMLEKNREKVSSVIFWGTLLPIILAIVFVITVVGVSGANTSPESLAGLYGGLGNGILIFALIFGLVSILTSYIMFVQNAREVYSWDLDFDEKKAWAISLLVPLFLFIFGVNNLTAVVSLSGAVIGGIVSIVYILLILKVKQKPQIPSPINIVINNRIAAGLTFIFILGFFTTLEYVGLKTVLTIFSVLFFYLYALIKSDKHNTSIYFEFFDLSKKVGLFFAFVFLIILTFGVFSVLI